MILLTTESSTLLGSVALFKDQKVIAYHESLRQGSHSDVLNLFIEKVLTESGVKLSDVDLFAAGIGPGSFTGIRISVNTIKTLAYCHNKNVVGVNSLENLAWLNFNLNPDLQQTENQLIAMINAYKNMVYIASFKFEANKLICIKEPEVVRVQNLAQYIQKKSIVVGDGYLTYQRYFSNEINKLVIRLDSLQDEPNAKSLGEIVLQNPNRQGHWSELLPLYLRASEAEENLKGIRYQALE